MKGFAAFSLLFCTQLYIAPSVLGSNNVPNVQSAPSDPSMAIEYILFTKRNKIYEQKIFPNDIKTLKSSEFDGTRKTVMILHGHLDLKYFSSWKVTLKDALLNNEDVNVILTHWHGTSNIDLYHRVVANTRQLGINLANMVKFLCEAANSSPERFHLIGHSLGAHIAGFAGTNLNSLGRITGLDPAGLYFNGKPSSERLDSSDATFVDVIHTDAAPVWKFVSMGMTDKSGHLDFWPNGGNFQPGCTAEKFTSLVKGATEFARRFASCSHMRSYDYFTESLTSTDCSFVGVKCTNYEKFKLGSCGPCNEKGANCAKLGYYSDEYMTRVGEFDSQSTNFYLQTRTSSPYCSFQYTVQIRASNDQLSTVDGQMTLTITGSKNSIETKLDFSLGSGATANELITSPRDLGVIQSVVLSWVPPRLSFAWWRKSVTMTVNQLLISPLKAGEVAVKETFSYSDRGSIAIAAKQLITLSSKKLDV